MNFVLSNYLKCRQKIDEGSSKVHPKDYPFFYLILGALLTRIKNLKTLQDSVECAWGLMTENKLPENLFYQWLNQLYQSPDRLDEFTQFLNFVRQADQEVNLIEQIEKLFTSNIYQPSLNISKNKNDTNKNHKSNPAHQLQQRCNSFDTIIVGTQHYNESDMQIQKQQHNHHQQFIEQQKIQKNKMIMEVDYDMEIIRKMQQDQQMARKFQEEEENFVKAFKKQNQEQTVCQICYVDLYDGQVAFLDLCGHFFHQACLIEHLKVAIDTVNFPILCPNQACKLQILDSDIKAILPKQLYQKYQNLTLKAYADMHGDSISWCPTADCGYMFFHEKGDEVRFTCLECKKQYCLDCRCQWHKDMTCKQYKVSSTVSEQDKKFYDFVKGAKFKQCPKCKFWVEKNQGCDHMRCKCNFEFCYKCGGVYMKCECVQKQKQIMEARRREFENMRELREKKKKQRKQNQDKRKQEKQEKDKIKAQKQKEKQNKKQKLKQKVPPAPSRRGRSKNK